VTPASMDPASVDYALAKNAHTDEPVKQDGVAGNAKAFPLALARSGERLRIAAFKTGKGLGKRLGDLGLHKGSIVEVVLHQMNGSVIVSFGNNRVALGAGASQMIIVTLITP